ncbi:MAG: hypothetical protein PW788_01280 [Micavibrio sp.]|nr:hypothetical protein [Micavibrio sp.]
MAIIEKLKNFKLRNIFKRAAQPPVPEEIVNNKAVRKAVLKSQRKKVFRRLRLAFLASATLSAALQFTPNLVSTPYDEFMASKGYPADLSQNFHAKEIRVYSRNNPLYPFHLAGRETGMLWHETMKEHHAGLIPLAIGTPFIYTGALFKGFTDMIPGGSKLDAYSMSSNDTVSTRTNFIRPPGEFSLASFLSDFSGIDGKGLEFKNKPEEIRKALFEFVMLHEARHGDQQKLAFITANEADSDLYAFRVMAARGMKPELLQEVGQIVLHARSLNAVLGGDESHVSTFALARGSQRIFDAHQDAAAFERLHSLLVEADRLNDGALPTDMPGGNRYFYITLALNKQGLLDEDPGMKRAAVAFVSAIRYFDGVSGNKIINPDQNLSKIDLRYLTEKYLPVPDKLTPDAKRPALPKPSV